MARKARNHAVEFLRRDELAQSRGFRSYSAQRYAIETGKFPAIDFSRIRSPKTRKAQEAFLSAPRYMPKYGGVQLPKYTPDERCTDWSAAFARDPKGAYVPENAKALGFTKADYRAAYMKAFVEGKQRYKLNRHKHTEALRHWFVDINHFYEADEYDAKYTSDNAA